MKILVVEDEAVIARRIVRLARELLGDELERIDARDHLDDADDYLRAAVPDLLLLDLDVQGHDGFRLLGRAVAGAFHTVVISAHTERAIEAFELGVIDFVPKPFTRERLRLALARARGPDGGGAPGRALRYLAVRAASGVELVELSQVHRISAADDYSELHLDNGTTRLHDKALGALEALLPPCFVRIHRCHLIDVRRAVRLRAEAGSRYTLVLADGTELPVGRTRIAALRARLI